MGRFSELSANKLTILTKLIESTEIVKCLINNKSDFLTDPIPTNFNPSSLIYSNLYPYTFVPNVQTEPKTFIK